MEFLNSFGPDIEHLSVLLGLLILLLPSLYLIRFLIIKYGRESVGFVKSLFSSIEHAITTNPDVRKLVRRYPRFFAFVSTRTDRQSFSGLPLTLIIIGSL